jgi:hypothetical protein
VPQVGGGIGVGVHPRRGAGGLLIEDHRAFDPARLLVMMRHLRTRGVEVGRDGLQRVGEPPV